GGSALLAENPKAFTQVLILGGLAEGVAVYGLLVAFLIMGG
ncbi:MAG: ATPase, partial [Candidatus Korarchaeum sp.]